MKDLSGSDLHSTTGAATVVDMQETWTVTRSKMTYDRESRTWTQTDEDIATGLSKVQADAVLCSSRNVSFRHELHAHPTTTKETL